MRVSIFVVTDKSAMYVYMKTYSFIGSDEFSGKTTVFNLIYKKLFTDTKKLKICLTSVGCSNAALYQNNYYHLFKGTFFLTIPEYLYNYTGLYKVINHFSDPFFENEYVLGKALFDFKIKLKCPANFTKLLALKKKAADFLPESTLLIDSVGDRKFTAHPDLSDGIYYTLNYKNDTTGIIKANDILFSLSLKPCKNSIKNITTNLLESNKCHLKIKSIVFDEKSRLLYRGYEIPFSDTDLKKVCKNNADKKIYVYLDGAFTNSTINFFAPFDKFTIILNNFTLYQHASKQLLSDAIHNRYNLKPEICLLHKNSVKEIFVKEIQGF